MGLISRVGSIVQHASLTRRGYTSPAFSSSEIGLDAGANVSCVPQVKMRGRERLLVQPHRYGIIVRRLADVKNEKAMMSKERERSGSCNFKKQLKCGD